MHMHDPVKQGANFESVIGKSATIQTGSVSHVGINCEIWLSGKQLKFPCFLYLFSACSSLKSAQVESKWANLGVLHVSCFLWGSQPLMMQSQTGARSPLSASVPSVLQSPWNDLEMPLIITSCLWLHRCRSGEEGNLANGHRSKSLGKKPSHNAFASEEALPSGVHRPVYHQLSGLYWLLRSWIAATAGEGGPQPLPLPLPFNLHQEAQHNSIYGLCPNRAYLVESACICLEFFFFDMGENRGRSFSDPHPIRPLLLSILSSSAH